MTDDVEISSWLPCVIVTADIYVPESAGYALMAVKEMEEEAFALVFGFAADKAREELNVN